MRASSRISMVVALLAVASLAHGADLKKFALKVVDEQGRAVPKFEALIYSGTGLVWAPGANGAVALTNEKLPPTVRVAVRADGFASNIKEYIGKDREKLLRGDQTITVARGEEVKVTVQPPAGLALPKDTYPDVYFEPWQDVVPLARAVEGRATQQPGATKPLVLNMMNAKHGESGSCTFRIAADTPAIVVGLHQPGFLQNFDDGPYSAPSFKNGLLTVNLPQPATLDVNLKLGSDAPNPLPFKAVRCQVVVLSRDHRQGLNANENQTLAVGQPLHLTDLPPGIYHVSLQTTPSVNERWTNVGINDAIASRFQDAKQFALRGGQTENLEFDYQPLDPNVTHGDRTAILQVETADGKPAVGRDVTVQYYVEHYGMLPVFSGKVPESGEITLSNIAAGAAAPGSRGGYTVSIGKDRAGALDFKSKDPTERFTFRCPPQAGDMAPDVEVLNVTDGQSIKLSAFRGKLVLLDFWATWCGPCQPALEKLDQLSAEKAAIWNGRVAIVPVSIDNEARQAQTHLISRNWMNLNPYWTGAEGQLSFEAPAMKAFVVNSVPTSFLIDPQGKILWRGHPMNSEGGKTLEDRIEAALSGKPVDAPPAGKFSVSDTPDLKPVSLTH